MRRVGNARERKSHWAHQAWSLEEPHYKPLESAQGYAVPSRNSFHCQEFHLFDCACKQIEKLILIQKLPGLRPAVSTIGGVSLISVDEAQHWSTEKSAFEVWLPYQGQACQLLPGDYPSLVLALVPCQIHSPEVRRPRRRQSSLCKVLFYWCLCRCR